MATRFPWFRLSSLLVGFLFLYVPILLLIVYSFNESRLVTVWAGFSPKWYGELLRDDAILNAAWVSFRIAAISATLALILGTMAAVALVRFGRFRGRTLFSGMISAPLVLIEAPISASPGRLLTGMGSPVSMDSSMALSPSST